MRIVFFGSSHGVPEANRRCSSTLIEVGERRYFIDMGTQSIEQLITRRMAPNSVKGIFFTHMHGDHTNGLISFVDLCTWYFKDVDPAIFLPEPVEDATAAMAAWLKCNGTQMKPFRFAPVKEGLLYEDEAIKVTAFRTKHNQMSHAYLVEAEGKRVLFSGDLCHKGPQEDFPVSVFDEPLDLAVCEVAHFPATKYLPLFENQPNLKQLCFNHYSHTFQSYIYDVMKALDIPVFMASDGTEIVL
ncbi:MAG: ribonuclease Z [Clostridia bacterium]|nr:ribonuclease Z [Clostridia bacterium]